MGPVSSRWPMTVAAEAAAGDDQVGPGEPVAQRVDLLAGVVAGRELGAPAAGGVHRDVGDAARPERGDHGARVGTGTDDQHPGR